MTFAVSGSSAMTSLPAATYITPLTTSGVTWMPGVPVSNDHACRRRETFAGVICLSGENRVAPGSRSCDGQSFTSAARTTAVATDAATRTANLENLENPENPENLENLM